MKTKKIIFLVGAFFLLNSSAYSQIWYFGTNAGIDVTGVEVGVAGGQIATQEGVCTQYDCNGNMLFYTDGVNIWDDTHTPYTNDGLAGSGSLTSILACPKPGTSGSECFIFYGIPGNAVSGGTHYYAVVDVTTKTVLVKDVIFGTDYFEGMTIAAHSNGTDYWFINHGGSDNIFQSWIIDGVSGPDGIAYSSGSGYGVSMSWSTSNAGYMATSKANDKIAYCNASNGKVEVLNFNNTTGSPTGIARSWTFGSWVYGCDFSPDGNYLYFTERTVALREGNISNGSTTTISAVATNGGIWMGGVRRAASDKIYIGTLNQTDIGVLNTPNGWGAGGAGWDITAIGGAGLLGNLAKDGLPTIPIEALCPVPLQVELIHFTATENKGMVDLNWVSASEENNEYYAIERSKNGLEWEELGRLSGMGTTSLSAEYNFSDENPFLGTSYYRLKQFDFRGKSKTFNVEVVRLDQKGEVYMVNINKEKVEFNVNIEKSEAAIVEIYNILGERVVRESLELAKGSKSYQLTNIQDLTDGVYLLRIKTANGLMKSLKFKL